MRRYTEMGQLFLSDTDHKRSLDIAVSKLSTPSRWVFRRLTVAIAGTVLALTLVVNPEQGPQAAGVTPASYERSIPVSLIGSGTFTLPDPTSKSITYNTALTPVDAAILASLEPADGGDRPQTVSTLTVAGLLPDRGYAVHAHTKPCGATGEDAGPHYQSHVDPAATPQRPPTDPYYANPRNEIWLDVRTNANGGGTSRTTVPFVFTNRALGSLVIHEAMTTATGAGQAGDGATATSLAAARGLSLRSVTAPTHRRCPPDPTHSTSYKGNASLNAALAAYARRSRDQLSELIT